MIRDIDKKMNYVDIVNGRYNDEKYINVAYSDTMNVYNCTILSEDTDIMVCQEDFMNLFEIDDYLDNKGGYFYISREQHLFNALSVSSFYLVNNKINQVINGLAITSKFSVAIKKNNSDNSLYFNWHFYRQYDGNIRVIVIDITQAYANIQRRDTVASLLNLATTSGDVGCWVTFYDINPPLSWATDSTVRMLNIEPNDSMLYELSQWQQFMFKYMGEDEYQKYQQSVSDMDTPKPFRFLIIDPEGQERWFLMKGGNAIKDDDGHVQRLYGTITDITAQVEYEQELKNLTYLLNETTKSGNVASWVMDFEKHPNHFWATDILSYMCDLPTSDIMLYKRGTLHANIQSCMGEEAAEGVYHELTNVITGINENYDVKYQMKDRDNNIRWYHSKSYNIVRDENGRAKRLYGVIIDIDEQIKRENQFKELTEILNTTMQSGNVGAWVLDYTFPEDKRLWASDVTANMCGFPLKDDNRYNPIDIVSNHKTSIMEHTFSNTTSTADTFANIDNFEYNCLYLLTNQSGEARLYSSKSQNITEDSNGNITKVYGVLIDIDEQIKKEHQLTTITAIQKTLQDISTRYINIDLDYIDDNIQKALELMGTAINAERAYVFQIDFEKNMLRGTYEWRIHDKIPKNYIFPEEPLKEYMSEYVNIFKQNKPIVINNIDKVDNEDLFNELISKDIKSLSIFPVFVSEQFYGFIGFDTVNYYHTFTDDEIALLKSFASIYSNILSRIQSEKKLRQNEERMLLSTETAKITYWEWNLENNTTKGNMNYSSIMGLNMSEINWEEHIHPDDLSHYNETINDLTEGNSDIYELIYRFFNPSLDKYIWIKETGKVLSYTDNNLPKIVVGISQDITDIKTAEEQLRKSANKLQISTESANIVTWEANIENNTAFLSDGFIQIFGGNASQDNFKEFFKNKIHPDDYDEFIQSFNEFLSGNVDVTKNEHRMLKNDGNYIWVFSSSKAIETDNEGKPMSIAGIFMDLDYKKKSELELIRREKDWENLFNNATNGIIIIDIETNVMLNVNPAIVKMFGANDASDFIGKLLGTYTPEYQPNSILSKDLSKQYIDEFKQSGKNKYEFTYKKFNNEEFIVEIELANTSYQDRPVIFVSLKDITEQKHHQQLIEQSERKLKVCTENANIAYWEFNIVQNTSVVSNLYVDVMGFDPTVEGANTWIDNIHPDDRDEVMRINNEHRAGLLDLYEATFRFYNMDKDKYIWVKDTGKVDKYDSDGNPLIMIGISQDITQSNIAEEKIKNSAERLRMATDSTNTITWEWDFANDRVMAQQNGSYLLNGYIEMSNAEENLKAYVHPDDIELLLNTFYKHYKLNSDIAKCEFRYKIPDTDNFIWVYVSGKVTERDNDGKPVLMTGVMMDVHEKKQNELMISIRERDLFNVYNTASNGILIAEADTLSIIDINPAGMHIFDTDDKSLFVGHKALLYSPEYQHDGRRSLDVLKEALEIAKANGSYNYEFTHYTVNNIEVICDIQLKITEYQNKPAYIVSFTDITRRKLTDMRMQSLLEIAGYEITSLEEFNFYSLTEILRLFQCNSIFLFNYDEESDELVIDSYGRNDLEEPIFATLGITCPLDKEGIWWNVITTGKPVIENNYKHNIKCAEHLPFEDITISNLLAIPITYQGKVMGIYGIANRNRPFTEFTATQLMMFSDSIYKKTELYNSTQQLIAAKEVAEKAAKVKSEFLANMSHEIRTPINAVIGLNELLSNTQLTYQQEDYAKKISNSAKNLLGIINDILDFSKMESGKLTIEHTSVNLDEILDDLYTLFAHKASERGNRLVINKANNCPVHLMGDPLRLAQVLINLTSNAIKFTENGTVSVDILPIRVDENNAELKFTVTDNGIGMTEEQIDNLFVAFQQADSSTTRKFGGTGLGLTITKNIIDLMDGTIQVNSKYGSGSEFSFTLMFNIDKYASIDSSKSDHDKDLTEKLKNIKGSRILIVDDNQINQQIVSELLHSISLESFIANNGQEAIEILKTNSYDLILMDLQMPVMDGYTATNIIRDELKLDLPIIALSADVMGEVIEKVKSNGMDDYLAKPIDIDELYKALIKHIYYNGDNQYMNQSSENTDEDISMQYSADFLLLQESLPDIDVSLGLNEFSKDIVHYVENIQAFADLGRNFFSELLELLLDSDLETGIDKLNNINELAGKIGANSLYIKLSLVKNQLEIESNSKIDSVISDASEMMNNIISQIDSYVISSKNSSTSESSKKLSNSDMIIVLTEVIKLLEDGNTNANVICEELFEYNHSEDILDNLKQLRDNVSNFDFDIAKDKCNEILSLLNEKDDM